MKKYLLILFAGILLSGSTSAQETLPRISVKNYNGKIIINWKNAYTMPVTNINIQRSFDSLKNYTTIGSVLNPQNEENGYSDNNPPYNKMYYRAFIAFEGGSYIISPAVRPVKIDPIVEPVVPPVISNDSMPEPVDPRTDSAFQEPPVPVVKNEFAYPSRRIYTAKDNTIVIDLPEARSKSYSVKFFNGSGKELFELKHLKEDYLIIEKVNFGKAGWYFFELYENEKLLEKNKFIVPKDIKVNNNR